MFLHNGDTVEGFLEMCNLHYNVAIVTIEYQDSFGHLPTVQLWDLPLYYSWHPKSVVALGRDANSKAMVSCGDLVRENSELNCKELMVSLCDISEVNVLWCYILVSIYGLSFLVLHCKTCTKLNMIALYYVSLV